MWSRISHALLVFWRGAESDQPWLDSSKATDRDTPRSVGDVHAAPRTRPGSAERVSGAWHRSGSQLSMPGVRLVGRLVRSGVDTGAGPWAQARSVGSGAGL